MIQQQQNIIETDVAIIGGGPSGSTCASLIRKYAPDMNVLILEKEQFPRDHVGESQLPVIGSILNEMDVWEKVEAANFPLKIGVTLRWGKESKLWDFDFASPEMTEDLPRPGKYEGVRKQIAFQVDRAMYDEILLDHAEELGTQVRQQTRVAKIHRDGDRVEGLELNDGSMVKARWYVDASGHLGILRRAMGVEADPVTSLQNIASWDYWENTKWAVKIGVGGTRVQVLSQPGGWIWFIPLGPTRTSIGFICHGDHYKKQRETKSVEEIYVDALANDERVQSLCEGATRRGNVETTKDWSFLAERTTGENWFLVGEAAGFADPVLAAGMMLAHVGARELAYVLAELHTDQSREDWLKSSFDTNQRRRVHQHIRFADFWYSANGQFSDLREQCVKIADESGLRLTPEAAWRWLAQGGFANDFVDKANFGTFDLSSMKHVMGFVMGKQLDWKLSDVNVIKLNLRNAEKIQLPKFEDGKIVSVECYERAGRRLPVTGVYQALIDVLEVTSDLEEIMGLLRKRFGSQAGAFAMFNTAVQTLEAMLEENWVTGKLNKKKKRVTVKTEDETDYLHFNRDPEVA